MTKKKTISAKSTSKSQGAQSARKRLAAFDIERDERNIYFMGRPVCERFDVVGTALSPNCIQRGIICERSLADGKQLRALIPFESLHNPQDLARKLLELRIVVLPGIQGIKGVATYIHILSRNKTMSLFEHEGIEWVGKDDSKYPVAVLGGELFTPEGIDLQAEVILQEPPVHARQGKLDNWREEAKAILPGNYIPITVCCAALSAPFKRLYGLPLCSLLLVAPSSSGKTTTARLAKSLFGPADIVHSWAGTTNAVEALALQHIDAPLVLDEMAEGRIADVIRLGFPDHVQR